MYNGGTGIVLRMTRVGVKGTYVWINIYNPGAFYGISRLFIGHRAIGFHSDVQRGKTILYRQHAIGNGSGPYCIYSDLW